MAALKAFVDVDRVLTAVGDINLSFANVLNEQITTIPTKPSIQLWEQSINNVILVKQYIKSIPPVYEALLGTTSKQLQDIREVSFIITS